MGRTRGARTARKQLDPARAALRADFLDHLGIEEEHTITPGTSSKVVGARMSPEDVDVLNVAADAMGFRGAGDLARAILVAYIECDELPGARDLAAKAREVRS